MDTQNIEQNPGKDEIGRQASHNKLANRLIQETSPYLLQHAHNPVDWYPWSEEAFERAIKEDRPVLVSIGYSACHWCHVMEKESFEKEEVALIMNQHFINIKVDREERPDIDHIYMEAVQAITGSGGWPLNVFLTPQKKPFYGGTYFPPERSFNRNSWTEILLSVAQAYKDKKEDIFLQAENLTEHVKNANYLSLTNSESVTITTNHLQEAFANLMKSADKEWGGFGKAPKFPQSFSIMFLLRFGHLTDEQEAKNQAFLSLDKMIQGGIYDQIGGGFSRYSTDNEWLVPHFEKMLYDNALLVMALAEAYQLSGKPIYKDVIKETLEFIESDLMHHDGGFFSALDADSEGVEGKFYVWEEGEVKEILGQYADLFCAYFDITPKGNWEGKNILRVLKPLENFASEKQIDPEELKNIINQGKKELLTVRNQRIRPRLDDKVLLGWNALMALAYCRAYAALGKEKYLQTAETNINFLLRAFNAPEGRLAHAWKNGKATHPAFLDDYNYLIMALTELAQVSGKYQYLEKARDLMEIVIEDFIDKSSDFYFYTNKNQTDVPLRKKELYDSATPSGNAIMAYNLLKISKFYDKREAKKKAEAMIHSIFSIVIKYPTSFSAWLCLITEFVYGTNEIVMIGKAWEKYLREILKLYVPHKVIMAGPEGDNQYPLMANKASHKEILLYLCKDYVCNQPVMTLDRLISLL